MGPQFEEVVIANSNHSLVINEIMLLLSEKRTSLTMLGTGIGLVTIPLSIISFLVATSRSYDLYSVLYLLGPLWAACIVLFVLGMYIISRSLMRIRRFDARVEALKGKDASVRALIDVD